MLTIWVNSIVTKIISKSIALIKLLILITVDYCQSNGPDSYSYKALTQSLHEYFTAARTPRFAAGDQ